MHQNRINLKLRSLMLFVLALINLDICVAAPAKTPPPKVFVKHPVDLLHDGDQPADGIDMFLGSAISVHFARSGKNVTNARYRVNQELGEERVGEYKALLAAQDFAKLQERGVWVRAIDRDPNKLFFIEYDRPFPNWTPKEPLEILNITDLPTPDLVGDHLLAGLLHRNIPPPKAPKIPTEPKIPPSVLDVLNAHASRARSPNCKTHLIKIGKLNIPSIGE